MKVLIKVIIPLLFVGCFSGCTTTSSASFRTRGSNAAAWQVQGKWNQVSDKVTITIDDATVIAGKVGLFSSSKTLTGSHRGHPVAAILTRATDIWGSQKMHCIVTIDGELAANFEW